MRKRLQSAHSKPGGTSAQPDANPRTRATGGPTQRAAGLQGGVGSPREVPEGIWEGSAPEMDG